jgi:hypothetical protein
LLKRIRRKSLEPGSPLSLTSTVLLIKCQPFEYAISGSSGQFRRPGRERRIYLTVTLPLVTVAAGKAVVLRVSVRPQAPLGSLATATVKGTPVSVAVPSPGFTVQIPA